MRAAQPPRSGIESRPRCGTVFKKAGDRARTGNIQLRETTHPIARTSRRKDTHCGRARCPAVTHALSGAANFSVAAWVETCVVIADQNDADDVSQLPRAHFRARE